MDDEEQTDEKVNYKKEILDIYQKMMDPFAVEFKGEVFDYEQNPSDPQHPQKTVELAPFE